MYDHFMVSPERLIIVVVLSLSAGWALGQYWRTRWLRKNQARLRKEAKLILREAHRTSQAKLVDAELEAKQIVLDEYRHIQEDIERNRTELFERERSLNERIARQHEIEIELEKLKERLRSSEDSFMVKLEWLRAQEQKLNGELERIAHLTPDEAQAAVKAKYKIEVEKETRQEAERIFESMKADAERRAREIIISAIERLSRSVTAEHTSCVVELPSVDMRGRVIGRDGRNIRAFEAITGVDLVVAEDSNQLVLSCHDPLRREAARLTMSRLLEDGRIQPTRIDTVFGSVHKELEDSSTDAGREACSSIDIHDIHCEILKHLGKLRFRSSYAQNVLRHSLETAHIAELIACEINLEEHLAKLLRRAALFHDVGKAMSEEHPGSHAKVGAELLRRCGEDELVVNAVAAHHKEVQDASILAALLRTADALSGARPGARREDLDAYVKRLTKIESLARAFPGVTHAYALQAGRDLHVVVSGSEVSDDDLAPLARGIANAIERTLRFQGEVRVSVVREVRAVEYASWAPLASKASETSSSS